MGGIRTQQIYWFCFVDMTSVGQNCHIFTDLVSFSTISAGITAVLTLSTISLQSRTELPKVPRAIILHHIGNILAILARTIFWNILANNILEYSCKQYFGIFLQYFVANNILVQVRYATALDWFIICSFSYCMATLLEFAGVHYFTKV